MGTRGADDCATFRSSNSGQWAALEGTTLDSGPADQSLACEIFGVRIVSGRVASRWAESGEGRLSYRPDVKFGAGFGECRKFGTVRVLPE